MIILFPISVNARDEQLIGLWERVIGVPLLYFSESQTFEIFTNDTIIEHGRNEKGIWNTSQNLLIIEDIELGTEYYIYSFSGETISLTDKEGNKAIYRRVNKNSTTTTTITTSKITTTKRTSIITKIDITTNKDNANRHQAILNNLEIKNHNIDFNPKTFSYQIILNPNETKLELAIELSEENATYLIKDNENLSANSIITIIVTSEDEVETTYIIKILENSLTNQIFNNIKDFIKNYKFIILIFTILITILIILISFVKNYKENKMMKQL